MDKTLKYLPKGNISKKWLNKVTDYYIKNSLVDDMRDMKNIKENYNLINGELSYDYFNTVLNPLDLPQSKNETPINDETIPVILPTINTLIGEIYDRSIDFKAYVMNPTAVGEKEQWLKIEYNKKLKSIVEDTSLTEEQVKLKLIELKQWKEYDSQDIRERFANHTIKDGIERLKFQQVTKDGWKDTIYNSQEIYLFDLKKGNTVFKRLDPLNVTIYGLPENGEVHKSEAIIYERYMTVSEIITEYGSELKKKDIDTIIDGNSSSTTGGILMIMDKDVSENETGTELAFETDNNAISHNVGRQHNKVLVKTVYFKVLRKVGDLLYINEETGEEEKEVVDENYEINEEAGEHIDNYYYINEYWQSTKILEDIYVEGKQCDIQMRDMNDKSIVTAPIVGIISITGNKVTKSIVDTLKPIQYQWTIFSKKLSLLWSRNHGKLVRIDISKIPKKYGFDVELFMSWITKFGIIVEDPFNEAMKGQPAGQFSSSVQSVDMELQSSISQALQYMIYLRELADDMIGVTRQRRGNMMASDGLGTTQESISRSLKITEESFQNHHELQKTLLYYVLEYNKASLVNKENKKMQYMTDDAIYVLYDTNPDLFNSIDMGIFVNNTRRQLELEQTFLQLAHAYSQSGAIKLSEIMDLYRTSSMSDKINKLKIKEKEVELMQQQTEKAQKQHEQEMQQMLLQAEQIKHENEMKLQQLKNEGIIAVAQIQADNKIDTELIKAETNDKDIEHENKQNDKKNSTDVSKALLQYYNKKEQAKKQIKK